MEQQHGTATQSEQSNNYTLLEQYKRYSAKILRHRLKEKIYHGQRLQADSTTVFASILFADISGFTRLSSRLSCEELKTHINEYFTKLLGIVDENNGDVVKFCGDAVMIMWAVPVDASATVKSAAVTMSSLCALQLLEECGVYKKYVDYTDPHLSRATSENIGLKRSLGARAKTSINSDTLPPTAEVNTSNVSLVSPPFPNLRTDMVELSLHCGIACGEVHCMVLGDSQRKEFLLAGPVLQRMGEAEALAQAGQLCVHAEAFERIRHVLHGEPVLAQASTPSGATVVPPQPHFSTRKGNAVGSATATAVVEDGSATVVARETSIRAAGATVDAFLLTGRLSDSLYQRRSKASHSSASCTTSTAPLADPFAFVLDSSGFATTQPLAPSSSTEMHSPGGVSTQTALYLESLAQELTARTPRHRPSRTGQTTPTHRRSTGAVGGRAVGRLGEGRSFLTRFSGSPLRCSLPGAVHDQDSPVLEAGEDQVSESSDLDSPCRSGCTEARSFALPSVSPLAQSGLPGDHARRPLRSRMSAALSHTRSSLGFLQVSWSSLVSSPSTSTYSTSQAPLLTAAGEDGLSADPGTGLEPTDCDLTDGLNPSGLDSCPGSPTAASLSCMHSSHRRQRRLPVAVLKQKLKYTSTASFASVRAYQNNWQHCSTPSTVVDNSTSNSLFGYKSESSELLVKHSSTLVTQTGAKRARLSRELCKFMHETAVRAIQASTVACLSEVRDVAVVFTQIHDLEKEFMLGTVARPQKVFCALLRTLRQHGGSLRQFVVDDKGCVAIACFGLAGSSNQNNCVSAVEYSVSLRTLLQTLGCRTSCGVTLGRLYCGLVGAGSRCEYAVMGSSVNLAARLMAAAAKEVTAGGQSVATVRETAARRRSSHCQRHYRHSVLVDATVYAVTQHHFQYRQMAPIMAKGYAEPVQVFATVRKLSQPSLLPVPAAVGSSAMQGPAQSSLCGIEIREAAPPVLFLEREDQLNVVGRAFAQTGGSSSSSGVPCLLVTGPVGVGRSTFLQHALAALPPTQAIATVKVDTANQYLGHDLVRELLCQVLDIPSGATIRELTLTSSTNATTGTEDQHQTPPSPSLSTSPQLQPRRDSSARASIPSLAAVSTVMLAAVKFQQQSRTGQLRDTARSQRRATELPGGIQNCLPMAVAPRSRCCSSSYLDVSAPMPLSLLHTKHHTAENTTSTAASAVPLSPHTVKYTPQQQSALSETTSLATACVAAIDASEEMIRRRDVNSKIQLWCERRLPATFTLSQAFGVCHPQLDFCDALSTHLQGVQEDYAAGQDLCALALRQLATWPLHMLLYLLNPVLNSSLTCESPQPLQELLANSGLSSEVEQLLQEVILEVLLLLALGVPLHDEFRADCCGTWVLAVDGLHLADQESQALLLRVVIAAQRRSDAKRSSSAVSVQGGLLLAMAVGGRQMDLTSTLEAVGTHSRTSVGSSRRITQRSQRYTHLRTSLCLDSVALCALQDSSDLSPEKLLELLTLHCECVPLSLLSRAATERILQETLGPQHWCWLLNHATTALGTTAASSTALLPSADLPAVAGVTMLPRLSMHSVGTVAVRRRRRRSTVLSPSCLLGIAEGASAGTGGRCSSEKHNRPAVALLPDALICGSVCSSAEQDSIVELIFMLAQKGLAAAVSDICTSLRETIVAGAFTSIQQVPAVERRSKLILEVLDGLHSLDIAVLKAAAVVGTEFDIPLLSVALGGMDLPQCTELAIIIPALRRLIDVGLLKTVHQDAHFTGTTASRLDERTFTDHSEPGSGYFAYTEAATQLVVYNLMLDTQRSAAHSAVASCLEHRYRRHCTHSQLLEVAQHYFSSSNITKKLEYLRRTAELHASTGDSSSAVDRYAELVLVATGSSLEHLLRVCRVREVSAIQLLTTTVQATAVHSSSSASSPSTVQARPNMARTSWRHRLFHNQVAVAAGAQARERSMPKQEMRDRVGAALSAPAAGWPMAVPQLNSSSSNSPISLDDVPLCRLIIHRRVLRRTTAATLCCSTALPSPATPAIAVRACVGILGITLVDVAVWVGSISDLLIRSGEQDEGLELAAACLHILDSSAAVGAETAVPLTPEGTSMQQERCTDACIQEISARTDGTDGLDAHTRSALEFLDQEAESYRRQQQQQQQGQTQNASSRSTNSSLLLRPIRVLTRLIQLSSKPQQSARSAASSISRSPSCRLINAEELAELSIAIDTIIDERNLQQQHGRCTRRRATRSLLSLKSTAADKSLPWQQCHTPAAILPTDIVPGVQGCPVLRALLGSPHCIAVLPAAAVYRQTAALRALAEQALFWGDALAATLLQEQVLSTLSPISLQSADVAWGHTAELVSLQYTQCMCMLSISLRHCGSAEAATNSFHRAQEVPLSTALLCTAGRHLAASGQFGTAIQCLSYALTEKPHHGHTEALQMEILAEQIWLLVLVGDLGSADKAMASLQLQLKALPAAGCSPEAWQQPRHSVEQLQMVLEIAHGGPALEEVGATAGAAARQGVGTDCWEADPPQTWAMEVLSVYRSVITALEYGYAWRPLPPSCSSSSGTDGSGQHTAILSVTLARLRSQQHILYTSTANSSSVVGGSSFVITGVLEFLCIYVSLRELDAVLTHSRGTRASFTDTQLLLSIALALSQRLARFDTLTSTCCAGLRPMYTILCVQYELYFYALCAACGVVSTSNCSSARQGEKRDPELREQCIQSLQYIVETVFKPPSFRLTKPLLLAGRRCVVKPSASISGSLAQHSAGQPGSWSGWWQRLYCKAFASAYTDDINDPMYVLATMASTAAAGSSSSKSYSRATLSASQLPVCLREYGNGFSVAKLQRLRAYLLHQHSAAVTAVTDCDGYAVLASLCTELVEAAADSRRGGDAARRRGVQRKTSEERSSCSTDDSLATSNSSSRSNSSSARALPNSTVKTTKVDCPTTVGTQTRLLGSHSSAVVNINTNTGASAAELCFSDVNLEKQSSGAGWEGVAFITPLYEHLLQKIDVTEENCREELFIYVERLIERMQT